MTQEGTDIPSGQCNKGVTFTHIFLLTFSQSPEAVLYIQCQLDSGESPTEFTVTLQFVTDEKPYLKKLTLHFLDLLSKVSKKHYVNLKVKVRNLLKN